MKATHDEADCRLCTERGCIVALVFLQPPDLSSSVLRCSLITLNVRPQSCRCVPIGTSRSLCYAPCFKEYPNRLIGLGAESNNEAQIKGCSALYNLAIGYDNKIPGFACPGLVDAILNVIQTDTGEARTLVRILPILCLPCFHKCF